MKMYVFEGTPDEISKVMQTMEPASGSGVVAVPAALEAKTRPPLPLGTTKGSSESYEEKEFVTIEFAREVMTRIKLSDPLKNLLIALNAAHPKWVSAADLYKASGYEGQRFAGLMGAFGRRMKHTSGFNEEAYFFDFDWDDEASAWKYRLPEAVLEAMRLEGIA